MAVEVCLANPWDMQWGKSPEKEEKKPAGKNPWDMKWDGETTPAQATTPVEQPEQQREMGMLWPVSWNAKDGSDYGFDSNAGLLGAVKRSVMAPGDAYAGKFDPTSEEGLARALEFAGTFGGGATNFGRVAAPATKVAEDVVMTNPRAGNPVKNLIIGEADSPALVRQRTDDLQAIGVENPTVGMVSGSNRAALKEQALAPTSNRIRAAQVASEGAVENSISSLADRMASATNPLARPTSKAELSEALIKQAETVKQAQVTKANELYGKVGELTGNSTAVGDSSRKVLAGLREAKKNLSNSAKLSEGPQLNEAIKHAEAIVKDLDAGATFTTIKEARTALGALTNDKTLSPALKGHLQTLRGALSEDMAATARATGDEAFSAWKTADDFYKTHKDVETGFGSQKGKKSDALILIENKNTDNAYDFLMGKSREGAERIRNLKNVIMQENGQEVWDRTKSSVLMRAATDANGNVSGSTYIKNFRQFAPEAKDEFWGPIGSAERDQMETIARAAETLKNYASKANHSNTQNHKAVNGDIIPGREGWLWAAFGGPKAFAAAVAVKGANAISKGYQARLMTNPATREWLSELPRMSIKKNGISNHVNKLIQIEQTTGDPATRAAIAEYMRAAGYEQGNR
jgi:hypothetical protein